MPGSLVVNIGSLLSDWTKGELLATLHRVVFVEKNKDGDDAGNGTTGTTRISLAFFADPDSNIAANLQTTNKKKDQTTAENGESSSMMTVADYILWRSGGTNSDADRTGVAYAHNEECRAEQAS